MEPESWRDSSPAPRFADRREAGRRLSTKLEALRGQDVVVLGLPRGGVPVAFEVARGLQAPLDVIVVRKLGVPFHTELAMGALGEQDIRVLDDDVIARSGVTPAELAAVERRARAALDARVSDLRHGRPPVDLTGRVALVVDDGLATGSTARAACRVARELGATLVVLAAPVMPAELLRSFPEADAVVAVQAPRRFRAVSLYYDDFAQTSDDEVRHLLDLAMRPRAGASMPDAHGKEVEVRVPLAGVSLEGSLRLGDPGRGLVVFAHGSGSSRRSPRNVFVARVLQRSGLGTLLVDLRTAEEAAESAETPSAFDPAPLASRLTAVGDWLVRTVGVAPDQIGYFGASTGAAAAVWAAAEAGSRVGAVVSRGGRVDLAGRRLEKLQAPTLLIVGGADPTVLELNRQAEARLRCPHRLAVVDGATHLFEERGTLAEVAILARDWFCRYLSSQSSGQPLEPAVTGVPQPSSSRDVGSGAHRPLCR